MSSIAMAADSTQADYLATQRRKVKQGKAAKRRETSRERRRAQLSKSCRKDKVLRRRHDSDTDDDSGSGGSSSDRDSDLDLSVELLPISGYVRQTEEMVEHMFRSISAKKLKAMLPAILKPIDTVELKMLCIQQLEGMSKKRICKLLDGVDAEAISSSGTEESSAHESDAEDGTNTVEPVAVDSTSLANIECSHLVGAEPLIADSQYIPASTAHSANILQPMTASHDVIPGQSNHGEYPHYNISHDPSQIDPHLGCVGNVTKPVSRIVSHKPPVDHAHQKIKDEKASEQMDPNAATSSGVTTPGGASGLSLEEVRAQEGRGGAAGGGDSDEEGASEAESVPSSLPSLVSEPEDSGTTVPLLAMRGVPPGTTSSLASDPTASSKAGDSPSPSPTPDPLTETQRYSGEGPTEESTSEDECQSNEGDMSIVAQAGDVALSVDGGCVDGAVQDCVDITRNDSSLVLGTRLVDSSSEESLGPTSLGPASLGPTSLGPASLGPTSLGPASLGPTSLGPASLGPTTLGPTNVGPMSLSSTNLASASLSLTNLDSTSFIVTSLSPTNPGSTSPGLTSLEPRNLDATSLAAFQTSEVRENSASGGVTSGELGSKEDTTESSAMEEMSSAAVKQGPVVGVSVHDDVSTVQPKQCESSDIERDETKDEDLACKTSQLKPHQGCPLVGFESESSDTEEAVSDAEEGTKVVDSSKQVSALKSGEEVDALMSQSAETSSHVGATSVNASPPGNTHMMSGNSSAAPAVLEMPIRHSAALPAVQSESIEMIVGVEEHGFSDEEAERADPRPASIADGARREKLSKPREQREGNKKSNSKSGRVSDKSERRPDHLGETSARGRQRASDESKLRTEGRQRPIRKEVAGGGNGVALKRKSLETARMVGGKILRRDAEAGGAKRSIEPRQEADAGHRTPSTKKESPLPEHGAVSQSRQAEKQMPARDDQTGTDIAEDMGNNTRSKVDREKERTRNSSKQGKPVDDAEGSEDKEVKKPRHDSPRDVKQEPAEGSGGDGPATPQKSSKESSNRKGQSSKGSIPGASTDGVDVSFCRRIVVKEEGVAPSQIGESRQSVNGPRSQGRGVKEGASAASQSKQSKASTKDSPEDCQNTAGFSQESAKNLSHDEEDVKSHSKDQKVPRSLMQPRQIAKSPSLDKPLTKGSPPQSQEGTKPSPVKQGTKVPSPKTKMRAPSDEGAPDAGGPGALSKTQLEILELEMRARAIKAMLKAQEELEKHERRQRSDLERPRAAVVARLQGRPDRQPVASRQVADGPEGVGVGSRQRQALRSEVTPLMDMIIRAPIGGVRGDRRAPGGSPRGVGVSMGAAGAPRGSGFPRGARLGPRALGERPLPRQTSGPAGGSGGRSVLARRGTGLEGRPGVSGSKRPLGVQGGSAGRGEGREGYAGPSHAGPSRQVKVKRPKLEVVEEVRRVIRTTSLDNPSSRKHPPGQLPAHRSAESPGSGEAARWGGESGDGVAVSDRRVMMRRSDDTDGVTSNTDPVAGGTGRGAGLRKVVERSLALDQEPSVRVSIGAGGGRSVVTSQPLQPMLSGGGHAGGKAVARATDGRDVRKLSARGFVRRARQVSGGPVGGEGWGAAEGGAKREGDARENIGR